MSYVSLDLEPKHYFGPQTANWIISDDVEFLSFTNNGPQPTISQYIAYDTLSPPNPFIAVTQDGRGNVVYDGGFPKFYNGSAPASGTLTFSQLTASYKYLYNAINFVANPTKVANNNKRILMLGDRTGTEAYNIKGTRGSDFNISFSRLASIVGFSITFKDRNDYGGVLNPTLSELENYALVILMSSGNSKSAISDAAVNNLISFRENGNGLIVITDHGPVYTSIEQASAGDGGFFAVANKLITNFGAYFTGDYNRTPVNVGFLRATYGDHPLYNGMLDSESIQAGGSESEVKVATYETFTKQTVPQIDLSTPGQQTISILAILKNGEAATYRFIYSIIEGEILKFKDSQNNFITKTEPSYGHVADFDLSIQGSNLGTLRGDILKNEAQVGSFEYDEINGIRTNWFAKNGETVSINHNDVITAKIHTPFEYSSEVITQRLDAPLLQVFSKARTLRLIRDRDLVKVESDSLISGLLQTLDQEVPNLNPVERFNPALNYQFIRRYFTNQLNLPDATAFIYDNLTQVQQAFLTVNRDNVIIDAQTGNVYYYTNEQWRLVNNTKPHDFLGSPRKLTNSVTGNAYFLNTNRTITKL